MQLLVSLNNLELSKYLEFTNSFIIGLKNYSVNYYEVELEEIEDLLKKYPDIELFISINKNIFNKDLSDLLEKLIKLSKLNIKGILFYDLSILKIVRQLNLDIHLCYHGTHMVTNYNICNYYFNHSVKYAYLSNDITCDEMLEIVDKTKIELMTTFIGHLIISHSKRKLVSNYYEHINKDNKEKINIISEKNKEDKYYVIENNLGTNILTYNILNGTRAFLRLKDKLSYGVLDSNLIDEDTFLEVLKLYKMSLDNKISNDELLESVNDLIGSYEGFFFKKTIYKVK